MKTYLVKADRKTSSNDKQYSVFIGRWQPLHEGHQWLFNQVLDSGGNVLIMIRDVVPDVNNPFTALEVLNNILTHYEKEVSDMRVKAIIIPDIDAICFGRGVGYDIVEFVPPKDIHDISATKIRKEMYDTYQKTHSENN